MQGFPCVVDKELRLSGIRSRVSGYGPAPSARAQPRGGSVSRTSRPRRLSAGLAAATLALTSLSAATAYAAPLDDPAPGPLMNYVLNTKASPGHVRKVEDAVKHAGGTVLSSYREFGGVVAQSTNANFKVDVRAGRNGREVQSVGATRTAAVSEGAGGLSSVDSVGSVDETTATPVLDPQEGSQWDMVQIKADQAHNVTDGSRRVLVGIN